MYAVQAYQFACTFELGVSATPPSTSAQERYLLPQNKTLQPSTVVTQVLLTPRQTLALLLLAKYAHLDRIRARVEAKHRQEDARRSALLNTPYMQNFLFRKPLSKAWTQPAPNHCPSRVSNQALDALAIFQDTASIIDCEEHLHWLAKPERLQNVIEAAVRDPVVLAQNAFLAHFARVRANAMPPSLKLCINRILATECVVAFVLLLSNHGKKST
jgi:hypothetical protein